MPRINERTSDCAVHIDCAPLVRPDSTTPLGHTTSSWPSSIVLRCRNFDTPIWEGTSSRDCQRRSNVAWMGARHESWTPLCRAPLGETSLHAPASLPRSVPAPQQRRTGISQGLAESCRYGPVRSEVIWRVSSAHIRCGTRPGHARPRWWSQRRPLRSFEALSVLLVRWA